jgi:integrase
VGERKGGSMKIQKRGKRWVTTIYNPETRGKVWVSGATREECKANVGKALERLQHQRETRETVQAFGDRWVDPDGPFSRRRGESTILHNTERTKAFRDRFAARKLSSITRREALEWGHENIGRLPAVRAMFSDAKRIGLIVDNPFAGLNLTRDPTSRPDAPTPRDVEAMRLAANEAHGAYGRMYGNLIVLSAYTGLRPGELYALEWSDVDLNAGELRVVRQFNQATRTVTPPKYNSKRSIVLLDEARGALEALPRLSGQPLVVSTPTGKRFSGMAQHHYWNPVRNLIGHPEWTFYSLRHHYGTYLASLPNIGPFEIAKAMGHKDNGATAMKHYIRMTERDVNDRIRLAARRARFQVLEGQAEGA